VSAEEYATIRDVMAELEVSEATAWKLIKEAGLERYRFPGKRETKIKRADIERLRQPITLPEVRRPGRPRGSSQAKKLAA